MYSKHAVDEWLDVGETELFFEKPKPEPELTLLVALIDNAILERDLAWINSTFDHPFSFKNCCDHLGIDFVAARRVLDQRIRIDNRIFQGPE